MGPRSCAASIGILVGLGLLALAPTAEGHPFHLHVANDVVTAPVPVNASGWVAQSFRASPGFWLSRVTLFVADIGLSDNLTVLIRADSGGVPAGVTLTQGTVDGPSLATWVDVDLDPYLELTSGNQRYWIVAHTTATGSDAYAWWDSGTDSAYADGQGQNSTDGLAWAPLGRDLAFRLYGFQQPSFTFSASASNPTVVPGRSVVLRVNFSNAGPGVADALWVNVSLPQGLDYVTDDAGTIGGVRGGNNSFAFANVAAGDHLFGITVLANATAGYGTTLVVVIEFHATDHNGAILPPSIRNVPVTFAAPDDAFPVWMWGLPALVGGIAIAGLVLWRWRASEIAVEDVFVADDTGVLLAHRSTTIIPHVDTDAVVAMFTVIQTFVRDTFSRGTNESMRALEFGERKILIERGVHHYLAVVYRGKDSGRLAKRVKGVSEEIERRFGEVLANWVGDVDTVHGITLLLPEVWARPPISRETVRGA